MNKNVFVRYEVWVDGKYDDTYNDVIEVNKYITSMNDIDAMANFFRGDREDYLIIIASFSRLEEQPTKQESES